MPLQQEESGRQLDLGPDLREDGSPLPPRPPPPLHRVRDLQASCPGNRGVDGVVTPSVALVAQSLVFPCSCSHRSLFTLSISWRWGSGPGLAPSSAPWVDGSRSAGRAPAGPWKRPAQISPVQGSAVGPRPYFGTRSRGGYRVSYFQRRTQGPQRPALPPRKRPYGHGLTLGLCFCECSHASLPLCYFC